MCEKQIKIQYNVPRCYLDMARAAMTSLHHPIGREKFRGKYGVEPIANVKLALVSVSIIYSYLAVEAFVNAQLYLLWARRHDRSPEATRFLSILKDVDNFESLKSSNKVRELGDRINTLCKIMGYKKPHEIDNALWEKYKKLAEVSRHFLVHPYPAPMFFQAHMSRIMEETKAGEYFETASSLIGHLHDQSRKKRPEWLKGNVRFRIRGVDLIEDRKDAG